MIKELEDLEINEVSGGNNLLSSSSPKYKTGSKIVYNSSFYYIVKANKIDDEYVYNCTPVVRGGKNINVKECDIRVIHSF